MTKVTPAWYVACESAELKGVLARTVSGTSLVLFRDGRGRPGALLDRCAHRNVPLSLGRAIEGRLVCGYHGWQYDRAGTCVKVPGLCDEARGSRTVPSFSSTEQDGLVWVYATPNVPPSCEPFRLPALEPGYSRVRRVVEVEASLAATLENALDVPHTAFLHRGLFRGTGKTNRIKVRVSRTSNGIEAEYIGEPRPEGWAGKILSPSGGIVTHFDRFMLPSIAQVEYRLGTENHLLVTSMCTPIEEYRTRITAEILFRTRFPRWLVKLILKPVAERIFKQDAFILKAQTDAIRRFGGEQFMSTPIDVLGLQIGRLLRMLESGQADDADWSREIEMDV